MDVDAIAPDHIGLASATTLDVGPGARLYPLRAARLQDDPEERLYSSNVSRRRIAFDIDEPCDWPALEISTYYRGHPLLEVRPDESEDPTAAYARLRQSVAFDGARPLIYDLPDVALRGQKTSWQLFGRAKHTWFRSLLYTLQGQLVPLWLASFQDDLQAVAAITGGSTALSVSWAGYTQFALGRDNRRDLRIELNDGTVLYRRVTAAAEAGETENLTLDAALDSGSIAPGRIRQISIMALATLSGDTVEIEHVTDAEGVAARHARLAGGRWRQPAGARAHRVRERRRRALCQQQRQHLFKALSMTTQRMSDNPDAVLGAGSLVPVLGVGSGNTDRKSTLGAIRTWIIGQFSAVVQALLGAADAAAARTELGLGTAATAASVDFATAAQGAKADAAAAGPGGVTDSRIAVFDGATGKLLKDGGKTVAEAMKQAIGIACADETTNLTAGTAKVTFRMPLCVHPFRGARDGEYRAGRICAHGGHQQGRRLDPIDEAHRRRRREDVDDCCRGSGDLGRFAGR